LIETVRGPLTKNSASSSAWLASLNAPGPALNSKKRCPSLDRFVPILFLEGERAGSRVQRPVRARSRTPTRRSTSEFSVTVLAHGLDQAGQDDGQLQDEGNVMVFSQELEATAGLSLLRDKGGGRLQMFADVVNADRLPASGYYDGNGKLVFFPKDEIFEHIKVKPTPPGGGIPALPPAPLHGASSHVPGSNVHGSRRRTSGQPCSASAFNAATQMSGVERLPNGHLRITGAGDPIEVEVLAHRLGNLERTDKLTDVARFTYSAERKQGVIFVSENASALSIERSMNHEIAELREAATGRAGKVDVLKRGALEPGAVLSGTTPAGRRAGVAGRQARAHRLGRARRRAPPRDPRAH